MYAKIFFYFLFLGFAMWVPVAGYEGLYEMDENKNVRNAKTWRTMPVNSHAVTLCKQGKAKRVKIAQLQPGKIAQVEPPTPINKTRIECMESNFGPWAPKNTPTLIGDAGQHLVCFELNKRGIRCSTNIIEGAPYDIIADFGDGQLFTVQVKSCASAVLQGNSVTAGYHFRFPGLNSAAVDLIAFAAIDIGVVYITPASSMQAKNMFFSAPGFIDRANSITTETLLNLYQSSTPTSNR